MDDALVTPEAVVLDLPAASVPTRMLAALLDVALQALVLLVGLLGGSAVAGRAGADAVEVLTVVGGSLLVFAVQLVYPTFCEWRFGATVGHAALGLRVVTVDGGPPSLRQAGTRTAVGILELEGTLGLLALVTAIVNPRGRRLGDLAAGTLVVRRRTGERAEVLRPTVPATLRGWVEGLDPSGLGQQERAALRRYLTRRDALPPAAREGLAADLAARLVPRAGGTAPPGVSADDVVVALAAVAGGGRGAAPPGPARPPGAPPRMPPPASSASSGPPDDGPRPAPPSRAPTGFQPPS